MNQTGGEVMEIWLEEGGTAGRIACPAEMRPGPGQYLRAQAPQDRGSPLAETLFPSGYTPDGFITGPGLPDSWLPGTKLVLRGRLGNGFRLPENTRRLALASLGQTSARLRPLVSQAIERSSAVALYCDSRWSQTPYFTWPAELEIYPLAALREDLTWADFLAVDAPLGRLADLPGVLARTGRLSCEAQVLVEAPFPCGGMADCGVCAVRTRHGWKLACKDGPVFDLNELPGIP